MSRPESVVHFSNRADIPQAGKATAGGLDVAISSPPANTRMTRIGWSGTVVPDSEYKREEALKIVTAGNVRYIVSDMPQSMYNGFYNVISNGALWPLMHFRKDIFDMTRFPGGDMAHYQAANALFADLGQEYLDPSDTAIVHDNHLLLLGAELIKRDKFNPVGYFQHTPVLDRQILSELTAEDQDTVQKLLRKLYAYDLVGLQARRDYTALNTILGLTAGEDPPKAFETRMIPDPKTQFGRATRFGIFPVIGKVDEDARLAEAWAKRPEVEQFKASISLAGKRIDIFGGLERRDYSKAHPNKATAVALAHKQGIIGANAKFLQVSTLGRMDVDAYKIESAKTEQAFSMLTQLFGDVARLHPHAVRREIGLGLARQSRIGLITPLRDGANLAAAEYIAAQDKSDPGVLVLSKFAGIAERVHEGVELVDPYRPADIARGLKNAFSRTLEERQAMHARAMAGLKSHSNGQWQSALIEETIKAAHQRPVPQITG